MNERIDRDTVDMLRSKVDHIAQLEVEYDREAFDQWRADTQLVLEHIFGERSDKIKTFKRYNGNLSIYWSGESDYALQERRRSTYLSDLKAAKSFLKGLLDFLERLTSQTTTEQKESFTNSEQSFTAKIEHSFHPVIASVAGPLFFNGHYQDAIRAAFIEVIDRVKVRTGRAKNTSGKEIDGDDLMNKTFALERRKLEWSDMVTDADKDFQNAMHYLFKGLVALRNEKGHVNVEQKDKEKAFEYLCLASLLMRQVDEARDKAGERA